MPVVDRDNLERSLCRESFYDFFCIFWPVVVPEPLVMNWHIEYLCNEVQKVAERVLRRQPKEHDLIINVSPGSTKSKICSEMLLPWMWCRDPRIQSINGSYSDDLSLDLAVKARNVIRSDKYQRLFPEVKLTADQDTKGLFVNTRGGRRKSTSTGGTITGYHGHIIVVDDPINPKQAASTVELQRANDWMDHTLHSRKIDKAITPIILIMQRLHQDDPTGHMLGRASPGSVRHICIPAELSEDVRPRRLKTFYRDGLMDPVRLPRSALQEAQERMGQYGYAGQFMQRPVPLGGAMFRTDLIRIESTPPRLAQVVRYWDKAGTAKGGAYTVGVKMGVDYDRKYWVLDVVRGQWDAAQRERIIRQTAVIDGRMVRIGVEQEPGSGGKDSAQATISNLAGYVALKDKVTGDKTSRADTMATQVNAENFRLVRASWNTAYLEELRYFPASTYKDQVDASSGAFAMLTKFRMRVGGFR